MKKYRVPDSLTKSEYSNQISDLVDRLTLSELNTLLMEVFRQKSRKLKPSTLLNAYIKNRFVKPSTLDPLQLIKLRSDILEFAVIQGFIPVELSPLAPFGCCSAMAPVDQNNIVTALRGTEVVSDTTNVLALEAGLRRRSDPKADVHLCCTHRAVRAQSFDNPHYSAHFELFCTISAGRDIGNYSFEKMVVHKHIQFYLTLLNRISPQSRLSVVLVRIPDNKVKNHLYAVVSDSVKHIVTNYPVIDREAKEDFSYYKQLRFNIVLHKNEEEHLIIDGGFTNWTQQLLNNKKERLLTSGLGMEYLLKLQKEVGSNKRIQF